jgi:ATP-dependent helicase HrpA
MLFDFYDERLGDEVVSGRHFDRWWKQAKTQDPELLTLTAGQLANRRGIDLDDYPDCWRQGGVEYELAYRYAPDTPLDGASLTVPLTALNQVVSSGLDLGVPGYRRELAGLLVRSLPKDVRRDLIPMNETVEAAFARLPRRQRVGRAADHVAGGGVDRDHRSTDRLSRLRPLPAARPPAPAHRRGRCRGQPGRCRR